MEDILTKIVESKRRRLDEAKRSRSLEELRRDVTLCTRSQAFGAAIRREDISVIAEIKRRSPSKGVIREQFNPVSIARNYKANGARAISILTEQDFFGGSLDDLREVSTTINLPLLRKDFIFDEYQILEAADAGADAILLIAAMLESSQMSELLSCARELELDVLVEVHDARELDAVLCHDVKLLGVNNRDLRTFATDLSTSIKLARLLPSSLTLVSESGIRTRDDIRRLEEAGFHAVLIGEELMRAPDEGAALHELTRQQ